jgi:arginine deiminase
MMTETLEHRKDLICNFVNQFIEESKIKSHTIKTGLYKYLTSLSIKEMVLKMIEGVRTHEVVLGKKNSIMDMLEDEYPFYTDPLPNILFQRDPFSSVGDGVAMGKMSTQARQRENIYYNRLNRYPLEGGDVLVLTEEIIAIGISNRTDPRAIEYFAEKIFEAHKTFKTVLAFNIPKSRAFMHLDTVFTQVDQGIFTIHPGIENKLTVFEITKNSERFDVVKTVGSLETILEKHLNTPITLIRCGGKDLITSVREQWNDGANTLAIAPGKVIVYDRNHVTNQMLKDAGVTVLTIPSSELSRGRGGPRCMSMPLIRE